MLSRAASTLIVMLVVVASGAPDLRSAISAHSRLQVNLGPVPVDKYLLTNYDSIYRHGYVPGCSTTRTVRACYQQMFASFAQQRVEGVRFMFYFCGGSYSTALNRCGTYNGTSLNATWANNMRLFLQDLATARIYRITPTPQWGYGYDANIPYCLDGSFSCGSEDGNYNWYRNSRQSSLNDGVVWARVPDSCSATPGATVALFFWPGLPFGVRPANTIGDPVGAWKLLFNNSYNCSPTNPYFAGWQHMYDVISSMLGAARNAGLVVHEFDIANEINIPEATAEMRLITDNKHTDTGNGNLLDVINYYLGYYGFSTQRVTWSIAEYRSGANLFNCGSMYGDSARILRLSSMLAAIGGAAVGWPVMASTNNWLTCGGAAASDWVSQPRSYPLPGIIDMHPYNVQSSEDARIAYNSYKALLDSWGPAGNYWHGNVPRLYNAEVMIGETHSNQTHPGTGKSCEGEVNPSLLAGYQINGFNMSGLANSSRVAVFRPWQNFAYWDRVNGGCYQVPAIINPPYTSTP
jgi:hypothetical protein